MCLWRLRNVALKSVWRVDAEVHAPNTRVDAGVHAPNKTWVDAAVHHEWMQECILLTRHKTILRNAHAQKVGQLCWAHALNALRGIALNASFIPILIVLSRQVTRVAAPRMASNNSSISIHKNWPASLSNTVLVAPSNICTQRQVVDFWSDAQNT